MTNFKFESTIDLTNAAHVAALTAFVDAVSGGESTEAEKKTVRASKAKAVKPKPAPAEEAAKEEPKEPEETKDNEPEEPESDKSGVTISEIRKIMAVKVGDNRDTIKKLLTGLGATSVTTLQEKNYDEFYEQLNQL